MDLTKESIEKIEGLVRAADGVDVEIGGRHYTDRKLQPVIYEPRPAALRVATLTGFVDYVKANHDGVALDKAVAIVKSHAEVVLATELLGDKNERSYLIGAKVDDGLKAYPFEQYLPVEAFVIAIRSMFEQTSDCERLISYVSRIKGGKTFSLDDDGIAQSATVQSGVSGALQGKEIAPIIVKLSPFRTFRDIEQIESEFLFRLKLVDADEGVIGCALFEADGGRWRNDAILSIAGYLREQIPNVTVIA